MCLPVTGPFKSKLAHFFYFQDIAFLLYIILFAYCYNEWNALAEWLGRHAYVHWDLGSSPRSPKTFVLFCFRKLCTTLQASLTICLIQMHAKWSQIQIQWSGTEGPSWSPVNRRMDEPKSQSRLEICWATKLINAPPKLAQTPWFYYSFLFFLLYFNCYLIIINYYYYYLI